MIAWILYLAAISAALGGAALAAEAALRRLRLPIRWSWFGAIAGSLVLPVLVPALRGFFTQRRISDERIVTMEPVVSIGMGVLEPVAAAGSRLPQAPALDPFILGAWAVGSMMVTAVLITSAVRLRLRSRRWSPAVVERTPVLVSADTGPAVLGLLGSRIVLPEWALELPEQSRSLLVRHELEHQRAGDVPLLNAGLAALALCPWNPFLWFAVRRLRLAIEVDCDARVLRTTRDLAAYGELLLAVGGRTGGPRMFAATAAVESRSTLEHRIREMTAVRSRRARLAAVPLALGALTLIAVACEMREPTRTPKPMTRTDLTALPQADPSAEPIATPRTTEPRLTEDQRAALARFLNEHAPASLRGTLQAILWVYVDDGGEVRNTRLVESSGNLEVDSVFERAIRTVRFEPALHHELRVGVWIQLPLRLQSREPNSVEDVRSRHAIPAARDLSELAHEPAFTPRTQEPRLDEQQRLTLMQYLERNYPGDLREAGISGRVILWVFVDDRGAVRNTRVVDSSGYQQFDDVAKQALRSVTFTPAYNRDQAVPVWVQLPLQYNVGTITNQRP